MASTSLLGLIDGSGTAASVLGGSRHAVWLDADGDVIVISTSDATRLPNGVQIAPGSQDEPFRKVAPGASATVGHGLLILEGLTVDIARWWDPRPLLAPVDQEQLVAAVAGLPDNVPGIDPGPLNAALQSQSVDGLLAASLALMGKGPGLTPEGDDYLAGAIAATVLLGEATDSESWIENLSTPLIRLARERTTSLSAALLECALHSHVAEPAGALLRALAGRGDIAKTHLRLTQVGHSSGPALAAGIVLGARALSG